MKRDFLKNLGIADDVIDQIMAENGNDINAAKGEAATLRQELAAKDTENNGLKEQIAQRDADIKKLQESVSGNEDLSKKLGELQTKYDQDTADLKKQLDDQKAEFETSAATEKFFEGVEFSSALAREAAVAQFKAKAFKLSDGTFQGGKEWLEDLKKSSPDAFKPETTPETDPTAGSQAPYFSKGMQNQNPANQPPAAGANPFNGWGFQQVRGFDKK